MRAPSSVLPAVYRQARDGGLLRDQRLEIGMGADGQLITRFVDGVTIV